LSFAYSIIQGVLGIRSVSTYEIEDTENTFKLWRELQKNFVKEFKEFTSYSSKDYELPDWHHGIMCLWVYLYNEQFYDANFINRVLAILERNGDCFAEFECYSNDQEYIGNFQVYKDLL